MGSKSSHSSITSTTESIEIRPQEKRFTYGCLFLLLATSVLVAALSMALLFKCKTTNFAGWSPIMGIILLLLCIASACTTYSGMRMTSLTAAFFSMVISVALCAHEIAVFHCFANTDFSSPSPFCIEFKKNANICDFVKSESKDIQSTTTSSSSTGTVKPEKNTMQLVLLILSILALIVSLALVILFGISIQMVGKPVYLGRKRHRKSIVVGLRKNVIQADRNRERNLKRSLPTPDETVIYDRHRQTIIHEYGSMWLNYRSGRKMKIGIENDVSKSSYALDIIRKSSRSVRESLRNKSSRSLSPSSPYRSRSIETGENLNDSQQ